jgi:hypothetical protein
MRFTAGRNQIGNVIGFSLRNVSAQKANHPWPSHSKGSLPHAALERGGQVTGDPWLVIDRLSV